MEYFGKIMQDIQVDNEGKLQYYSNGIIFSSTIMIMPVGFAYLIYEAKFFVVNSLYFWLFTQIAIFALSALYVINLEKYRQKGISIKKTKNEQHLFISIILMVSSIISWIGVFFCYALLIENPTSFYYLILIISLIAIFFTLTFFAMIFSFYFVFYPNVRIYMENLSIIRGKLIKYDETVQIIVNDKLIRINKDKILLLEELD